MLKIYLHPSAVIDIRLAQDWYGGENKIVADRFSSSIVKTIRNLENFPRSAPIFFSNIRRIVVHGFPYNIYYQFEEYEIMILAVSHTHRDQVYLNDMLELRKY